MNIIKKMLIMCLVCMMFVCVSLTNVDAMVNKTPESALKATLDKTYTRIWNGSNYDNDFYNKVYVDEKGELKIKVSKPVNNAGDYEYIGVTVYDSQYKVVWKHHSWGDVQDLSKNYYEYKIGVNEGTYYINLEFDGILFNESVSSTYSFSLEKNEYVEIENNEKVEHATVLNLGHKYKGVFGSSELDTSNHDFYKFYVSQSGNYEIVLDDYRDFENTWVLMSLLDENRKELDFTIFDFEYNSKLKTYSQSIYLNKGTYYIDLNNNFMDQIPYHIGVYSNVCLNKGHSFSETQVSVKPTVSENGVGIATCSRCGHHASRVIPRVCQFSDVIGDMWYFDVVVEANKIGLMTGASETLFKPDANMNRAMATCVFHRMEGSPKITYKKVFSDVNTGQYYSAAVTWAKNKGVIKGYNDGTFKPIKSITREEMAIMIANFAKYKGVYKNSSYDLSKFKDYKKVSSYAKESLQWCVEKGLLSGKDNGTRLDPLGTATRAECSKMLLNAYKMIYKN